MHMGPNESWERNNITTAARASLAHAGLGCGVGLEAKA